MRLLMIGPASIHTTRQIEWAAQHGHDVTFASSGDSPTKARVCLKLAEPRFLSYARRFRALLPRRLMHRLSDAARTRPFRRLAAQSAPDLVHVNSVTEVAYYCVRAGMHPLVLTVWGSDINQFFTGTSDPFFRGPPDPIKRWRIATALRSADLTIVDSVDMIGKCEEVAEQPLRTELLPLGIDTRHFSPASPAERRAWRERHGIPDRALAILSARAWARRYGHDMILEAFARARASAKRELLLVYKTFNEISGDPLADQLKARAAVLGVAAHIRWLPQVPMSDLPQVFGLADVVVNFPVVDAFPVTFFEAAACGRPVITGFLPAYQDTIAERYFRCVPSADVGALAAALVAFAASDPTAVDSAVRAAREEVLTRYNQEVTAGRLMRIYDEVLRAAQARLPR
jgi:glycosyltransferase involved in cell wall biosynthesis